MSEMINNREYQADDIAKNKEQRQKILKELITELHNGKSVDEVKPRFEQLIQGITTKEITEMEQALIREGMPVEEIQNLCDVHAAVFKGSIEEIHRPQKPEEIPGHPVHTFRLENRGLERLIDKSILPHLDNLRNSNSEENRIVLSEDFQKLWEIDHHYSRKENLLFPYMEKYGITAPPKVMWGVDDEIRESIKGVLHQLQTSSVDVEQLTLKIENSVNRVKEMIYKEENILFPMVLETLTEDEWIKIANESDEIGYTLNIPKIRWEPARVDYISEEALNQKEGIETKKQSSEGGPIQFDAGAMTTEEVNAMLNTLPLDITFVDRNGVVKYFTQGKERIFARPKTVIGRDVSNCHPPASVHIVEQIVEDLKSGRKDHEDFWIKMKDKYVFIRYYAVRNSNGEFMGVMEVTQDIKPIQEIEGEKRLVNSSQIEGR